MKTYDQFRDILKPAYPISGGKFRLPISTSLMKLGDGFYTTFESNIIGLTQQMLDLFHDKDISQKLISQNGDGFLIDFIDGDMTGIVRRDCVMTKDGSIKVLELNADYPDGLLLHDATYSILSDDNTSYHQDLFLRLFDDKDDIFVLHDKDSVFLDAYHIEYIALKNAGKRAYIGTIYDLDIRGKDVFYGDHKISYIKRCAEVGKLGSDFFENMKGADIGYINTFALRPLGYKNALSYISHPYILKTSNLSDTNKQYVRSHKDLFVIKPSNLFEGKSIFIGRDMEQATRDDIVETYHDKNYVLQELADVSQINNPFYQDGAIIEKSVYFDICPHVFINHGKIIGIGHTLTRFSESKILNVALGGGIGYLDRK